MRFIRFGQLQLDIVGIVAILGEGSTSRNAQASALSWHHILPRLYPAPQALMKHHQTKRLPTEPGVIVGASSGRVKNELNFFTQLLHNKELENYELEFVEVKKKESCKHKPAFGVGKGGHLAALSILGSLISIVIVALSIWRDDGPALVAVIMLSFCSSTVGLASWWKLNFPEEKPNQSRVGDIPRSDVVIFYPKTGAFRVVRCDEYVSRMYFKVERCDSFLTDDHGKERYYPGFSDDFYRLTALLSTVLLMVGLILLGNATAVMQAAFAGSYILLNVLYWISSAADPTTHVWKHNYEIKTFKVREPVKPTALTPKRVESPRVLHDRDGNKVSEEVTKDGFRRRIAIVDNAQVEKGQLEQNAHATGRHGGKLKRAFSFKRSATKEESEDKSKTFTGLTVPLWWAIALTENTRWARATNIAPNHEVWDQWLAEAQEQVERKWSNKFQRYMPRYTESEAIHGFNCHLAKDMLAHGVEPECHENCTSTFTLPNWNYQARLGSSFRMQAEWKKQRYTEKKLVTPVEMALGGKELTFPMWTNIKLRMWARRARRAAEVKYVQRFDEQQYRRLDRFDLGSNEATRYSEEWLPQQTNETATRSIAGHT